MNVGKVVVGDTLKTVMGIYNAVYSDLSNVLIGQNSVKKVVTSSLLCDKNSKILLTGNTGTGKTTLSNYLGACFTKEKISVTSDLLPSDVQEQLIARPDFNFLHIDEFNRASGKLQAAFLELFAERQISYTGATHSFGDFYVFATQNSADIAGIFNVPQAVYDRFDVNINFGNLNPSEKKELLFSGFEPKKITHVFPKVVDFTSSAIANFKLTDEEQDLLMAAFNYIDAMTYNGSPLFAGSNIRAHQYAIKLAKINALADGRTAIKPSDLTDYITYLYIHRIDQNVARIGNIDVNNLFAKATNDILSLKRKKD